MDEIFKQTKKQGDFKLQSLIGNFREFVEPLTDLELSELCNYMTLSFNDSPPNKIAEKFIDEMIGIDDYLVYVADYRRELEGRVVSFRPMLIIEHINNLKKFLMAESSFRFHKHLKKIEGEVKSKEDDLDKLKLDLKNAIEDSFFDGVFDKCDGWCNVADVLIKHDLINLSED
jgi:hypothetical protein